MGTLEFGAPIDGPGEIIDRNEDTEYSQDNWNNTVKSQEPNLNSLLKERVKNEYPTQEEIIEFNRKENRIKERLTESEMVDHPNHYGGEDNPYEAIKVIEAWELGFNLGNTIKYVSRAGKKLDVLEDLKKASWYINREINKLKNN